MSYHERLSAIASLDSAPEIKAGVSGEIISFAARLPWSENSRTGVYPSLTKQSVTQVAIEMHSPFAECGTFTESRNIIGSPWTDLPFGKNCASRWLHLSLHCIVRAGREWMYLQGR
jgi:hypothetical protein